MKVKELIEQLQKCNPEVEVIIMMPMYYKLKVTAIRYSYTPNYKKFTICIFKKACITCA